MQQAETKGTASRSLGRLASNNTLSIIGNPFNAYLSRLFIFSAPSATSMQLLEKSPYLRGQSLKSFTSNTNNSKAETTCKVSVAEVPVATRPTPLITLENGSTKLPLKDSCAFIGAKG